MLAAITCLFNPCNFQVRNDNYWRFRESISKQCDLFTIEAVFPGQAPTVPDAVHVMAQANQLMWLKERLFNIMLEELPACYDNIAWIDSDLEFVLPEWPAIAEQKLNSVAVVQLYETIDFHEGIFPSIAAKLIGGLKEKPKMGGAWAGRRQFLEAIKFYDAAVLGGGDTAMACAFVGHYDNWFTRSIGLNWRSHWFNWAKGARTSFDFVPGRIRHMPHGSVKRRNYRGRNQPIADFDPDDLVLEDNRLYSWAHSDIALRYFSERAEDG